MSKPQVFIDTLGCRLNQHESESILRAFVEKGYVISERAEDARIRVVNTCTVTKKADNKSLARVKKLQSLPLLGEVALPEAILTIATGCAASSPEERFSALNILVVPNEQKLNIPSIVDAYLGGEMDYVPEVKQFGESKIEALTHTRASLKIQDGCDNFCTFCIIPHVRGSAVSRPTEDIVAAALQYEAEGYHEIVLTGVNMTRYVDPYNNNFTKLLTTILNKTTRVRVRLASLEPDQLGPDFVELFKHPRLCPSLHLCLQSGSEKILLAMRRQYTKASYYQLVMDLRSVRPDMAISTDIMVGFPGETDEDFKDSLNSLVDCRFSSVHAFTYSMRPLTRAERMPQQVATSIKEQRHKLLVYKTFEASAKFNQSLRQKSTKVIIETTQLRGENKTAQGMSEWGIPTIIDLSQYSRITNSNVSNKSFLWNALVDCEIYDSNGEFLFGRIIDGRQT